jgi:hypothetical protein
MEKTTNVLESSNLYRKIDALPMVGTDREEVTGALEAVARLQNAFDAGGAIVARVIGWFTPHPALKHQ